MPRTRADFRAVLLLVWLAAFTLGFIIGHFAH